MEYQIEVNTRRCASTGRELRPGDKFYSVLVEESGRLVRLDYASDAWQGPPHGAFSFWSGRVPPDEHKRRPPIDDDLLAERVAKLAAYDPAEEIRRPTRREGHDEADRPRRIGLGRG